ncbi:MAG TPA: phosphotransferase [Pyrinomonadaceae bacterium]
MDSIFAQAIAEKYFGIQAGAEVLPSERDYNFRLTSVSGEQFVLKVANVFEPPEVLEAQTAALTYLETQVSFCPRIVPSSSGAALTEVRSANGATYLVRVVRYIPGVPLGTLESHSPRLLRDLGRKLGRLDRVLLDFDHPGAHREFYWDLANGSRILEEYGPQIKTDRLREVVLGCREHLSLPVAKLRRSVIHGDANDYNVLVDQEHDEVVGLIDFGDMIYSYTVGDLAVAIAYVVLGKPDAKAAAAPVIEGYVEELPLTKNELDALWTLVRLRLCMSVCIAAHQQAQQPENDYLGISQKLIAETLPRLLATE